MRVELNIDNMDLFHKAIREQIEHVVRKITKEKFEELIEKAVGDFVTEQRLKSALDSIIYHKLTTMIHSSQSDSLPLYIRRQIGDQLDKRVQSKIDIAVSNLVDKYDIEKTVKTAAQKALKHMFKE